MLIVSANYGRIGLFYVNLLAKDENALMVFELKNAIGCPFGFTD